MCTPMPPKKKNNSRKKAQSGWNTRKIFIVLIGVLLAVAMIVSLMPMSMFSTFQNAKVGDVVTVDYILRDDRKNPVATSNQEVYNTVLEQGGIILLTDYLEVPVNTSSEEEIIPVSVRNEGYVGAPFGLLAPEWNAISDGLVGMREGGTKTVTINEKVELDLTMDQEQVERVGLNFTQASKGTQIPIVIAVQSYESLLSNTTPTEFALRIGYVLEKTDEDITLNHEYPEADIRVVRIASSS